MRTRHPSTQMEIAIGMVRGTIVEIPLSAPAYEMPYGWQRELDEAPYTT